MTPAAAAATECWSCGASTPAARVAVETVLRGRPASEGGPYRVFRCLACGVENGVVASPHGAWMLYPLSGLEPPTLLDRLLSGRERRRLEQARAWWAKHLAQVERFRRGLDAPSAAPPPAQDEARPPRPRPVTGPRAVLGVPPHATADDVRRAFRRLAKRHHPDRSPGPESAARFREIRAAYETLLRELS